MTSASVLLIPGLTITYTFIFLPSFDYPTAYTNKTMASNTNIDL